MQLKYGQIRRNIIGGHARLEAVWYNRYIEITQIPAYMRGVWAGPMLEIRSIHIPLEKVEEYIACMNEAKEILIMANMRNGKDIHLEDPLYLLGENHVDSKR